MYYRNTNGVSESNLKTGAAILHFHFMFGKTHSNANMWQIFEIIKQIAWLFIFICYKI